LNITKPKNTNQAAPYEALWAAALECFIHDAQNHSLNENVCDEKTAIYKEAFDDLFHCGKITRHLCKFLNVEAEWLSKKFRKSCKFRKFTQS